MPATKPRAYQVYDIDWKQAVRALSDSNINLTSPGALVIDAVVLDPYDRVLLTAQTDATENGIYQVNAAQTLLVPAPDWVNINSGLSSAVNSGLTVAVTEGADYAQTTWTLTTSNPIVIGVTAIVFEQVPEASDRIGNIYFDGSIIELANSVPETDISILPSGAGSDVGMVIPNDATANIDDLHIFNLATNGNVKISTAGGDWRYDTAGNFTGNGNVQAGYFLGNGALLTGISTYSNNDVANYLPTYAGNLGVSNINFVSNSRIHSGVQHLFIEGTVGGVVEITTDNGNYTWGFDDQGELILPMALNGTSPLSNSALLYTPDNLAIKSGDDILIVPDNNFLIYAAFDGNINDYSEKWEFANNEIKNISGATGVVAEIGNLNLQGGRNTIGNGNVTITAVKNGAAVNVWTFDNTGNLSAPGNISANYFIGNGAFLTGISAGGSYSNANVANYLPTYTGNLGAGNINFVNGSTIKTAVNNVNMNANTGGAVEITTDGGNYTWSYDNYGWMYLPQAQAAYTPVVNGSVLFGSEALVFKAGYANLIFDNTGNTTTANYFLGNVQGLVGTITNLDSLNFDVENISARVANNGVNIGAGGFNNIVVLPTDVLIQNVPLSVAANIVGVTADNDGRIEWMGNSSGDGGGYTTLTLTPDTTVNDQVLVLDPTAPGHIHLRAPGIGGNVEQPTANIFLGPENTNFEITAQYGTAPEARIHSAGNTWTFGNDGNLALPGNTSSINYANGISILDGYATVSSQYLSNATSQSYNDFVTGNYYNASTLEIDYTAYAGASTLNLDIAYQAPLTANIGISVGAVNAPLIQANANIVLEANSGTAQTWRFGTDGNLTLPGDLVIAGNTSVFGTNRALIQPDDDLPLLALSSGANGAVSSIWVEDIGNIGTSNIAAVYANPTVGSKIVRIVVGQNGVGSGPNLWDFDTTGNLTAPGSISATGNIDAPYIYGDTTEANVFVGGTANISGNITAGNFIGAGSNIELVAQSEQWVFDTTGNLTLPSTGYLIVTRGIIGSGASPAPTLSGFSSISTTGVQGNISASGNLLASGYANITGNINGSGATFSGNITANTAGYTIGYRDIPQVPFTGDATLAAADGGKHYYSTLSTGNTLTIANNSSVSWTIGTAITVVNRGTGNITIAQGSGVSLYLAGNSTAANRTVSSYGMASLLNVAANVWMINGTGIA